MLIIAIPKSASTSLMLTLGARHGLLAEQRYFPERPLPEGVQTLWKYHGDVREINSTTADLLSDTQSIYKQHLPPTPNNQLLLQDARKVILLREPAEIIGAYRRARRRLISVSMPGFSTFEGEEKWLNRSKSNGLYQDLESFIEGWLRGGGNKKIVIWHHDLIADPGATIRRIEAFWGLPLTPDPVALAEARYSRTGYQKLALRNLTRWTLKQLGLLNLARKLYRAALKRTR